MALTIYKASVPKSEELVEIERRLNEIYLVKHVLGSLLPGLPAHEESRITTVLDIACGPGTWALELAQIYPTIHVLGIDTNAPMIAYANCEAQKRQVDNARYLHVTDIKQLTQFHRGFFDLISVQQIQQVNMFMNTSDWLPVVQSRLRPGGWLFTIDSRKPISNAPAHQEFWDLIECAIQKAGRKLDEHDQFLEEGFATSFCSRRFIDYSTGVDGHEAWQKNWLILSQILETFLLEMSSSTTREYLRLLAQRQHREMSSPTFRAIFPLFITWKQKEYER